MLVKEKLEMYQNGITTLRRGNNNEYYSLLSFINMIKPNNRDIIMREFNNIEKVISGCNRPYIIHMSNVPIRQFGEHLYLYGYKNTFGVPEPDVKYGDDIWVNPYIILLLLDRYLFKADSIETYERFRNLLINLGNICLESYDNFVLCYNKLANDDKRNTMYSQVLVNRDRFINYLHLFCHPSDVDELTRKIDKYVLHKTMSISKRDYGIPKHENPYRHMDLGLLEIYNGAYIEVMNKISSLYTPAAIRREVDNVTNGNMNHSMNMDINNTFKFN